MTVVTPPTIVPNSGRPPEDDLDGLLRDFFKAEMPKPWPAFTAPAPSNSVTPLRRNKTARLTLWRSRLALAAAILLLIAGTLFLSGRPASKDSPAPAGPGIGTSADHSLDDVPFIPDKHDAHGFQQGTIPRN